MKTLFIGGVKSGKSRLAEAYILERAGADKSLLFGNYRIF